MRKLIILLLAAVLAVSACGGSDDPSDDGVATLGGDTQDGDQAAADDDDGGRGGFGPDSLSAEERARMEDAMLDFARCMREHGVEVPDPNVDDGGGGFVIAAPASGMSPGDEDEFRDAEEACRPIMEEVEGLFDPPTDEELARMRDEALEFAQCMREHGVDMPDPQFDDQGRMTMSMVGGGPEDADFQEAAEACGGPVIRSDG